MSLPSAPAVGPSGETIAHLMNWGGPTTSTSFTFSAVNSDAATLWLVTQIDVTATQANPVTCFCGFQFRSLGGSTGPYFYWDSQSAGQGNGVRWFWRGAMPLGPTDGVAVVCSSSANIVWGGVISGLVVPRASYTR